MRQASWEELFRQGEAPPEKGPPVWARIGSFNWEDVISLIIVLIGFLTVVQSIDSADWVPEMPSLYAIAFLGLLLGVALARLNVHELLAHLIALTVGTAGVLVASTSKLDGSLSQRTTELTDRVGVWADALISGGISNDNLPFVLLVVALTFLTAYFSAWSIFRWYNAWLGLVPGGLALLTNISYLPGQRSISLLIYLFCAILLVARVNLLRHKRSWRQQRTGYPDLISLHVLNVTVWVAFGLLALAWALPVGSGNGALLSVFDKVTSPVTGPLGDLGRVFSAIDSKKGGTIHRFGATLPLQGSISLGGGEVMRVTATEPGLLRAQSYDFYTAAGWKIGANSQITTNAWPASKPLQDPSEARRQLRRPVSVQVTNSKRSNVLISAGDPLSINVDSRVVFGPDQSDVTSVRPAGALNNGSQYRVDSTVSNASVARLRAAPATYAPWLSTYLQLPSDLPRQVRNKAQELAAGKDNNYDKAVEIEQYLRTFAVDTNIKPAPSKRDSVAYFLFDVGRGYFDYHASAMVVLLRSLNIPARLAVGYIIRPQDRIPDSNIYVVNEGNAFAWPEVYFPGLGWVEFNPTPSEPRINRTGTDDQEFNEGIGEEVFLDEPLPETDVPAADPAAEVIEELQLDEGSSLVSRIILSVVLVMVALTVAGGGLFQYSWHRGLRGLDYPIQVWEKTLRLAKWSRIRPLPQETPREIVERLRRELPEVEGLDYMGETYLRSRYGRKQLTEPEKERLAGIWKQARNTLLARLLRWK